MTRKPRLKTAGRNDLWFVSAGLGAFVVLGIASHADAQGVTEPSGPSIAWSAAVGSDYVFRGVSQTEEDAAVSGGVALTGGTFYAGAWASNVAFPGDPHTNAEIDVYAGATSEFAGWIWDVGAIAYVYPGQPEGADNDYVEAKVAASCAIGPAAIGAAVYWSPDFFGAAEDEATYVEANAAFSLADKWTISGAVGRQFLSSEFDYTTWNLGVARQLTDILTLDVRHHDTDAHDFGDIYGRRAVVSLKAAF